jgi:hypothetical protein
LSLFDPFDYGFLGRQLAADRPSLTVIAGTQDLFLELDLLGDCLTTDYSHQNT